MTQYRFLKEGEVIKKGDKYFGALGTNPPKEAFRTGTVVNQQDEQYKSYGRRLHAKTPTQIAEVVRPEEVATPPVQYRFLQVGEVASAKTDEVNCGKWDKVYGLDGHVVTSYEEDVYRRPVRLQDATHRFLDLGEKIANGDEWAYQQNDTWWIKSLCKGVIVGDRATLNNGKEPLIYRRLLTPEAKSEETIQTKPLVIPDVKADAAVDPVQFGPAKTITFTHELKLLVAKYKLKTGSDTPDYILAKYLVKCLKAFDGATTARDSTWLTA
jgi:hypothetical protein